MSYKKIILREDPVAYWPLDGISAERSYANVIQEYPDYQQWLDFEDSYSQAFRSFTIEDLSVNNNHAAFILGLPLFQKTFPLSTKSVNDTNISSCKIINDTKIEIVNVANYYKGFYYGMENVKFGIEFWISLPEAPSVKNSFLTIESQTEGTVAEIYALEDKVCFNVNGSDAVTGTELSYTTTKQISSWDNKIHIFAAYDERKIEIYVNGISQETITFASKFKFKELDYSNIQYTIGKAPEDNYFIIGDLAFYERKLSVNEIKFHMVWASKDSDPILFVQQGSAYHLDISKKDFMYSIKKVFSTKSDYDQGSYFNIYAEGTGLTIPQTDNVESSVGTWYYNLPIPVYENFKGVNISWDSGSPLVGSKYSQVLVSYDGGDNYQTVENDKVVPYFISTASNVSSSNMLIKVNIGSDDTSLDIRPRLDNLSIEIYKDLTIIADSGGFYVEPLTESYNLKKNEYGLLSRSKNLGLLFVSQNGIDSDPGVAKIESINESEYSSIEFWFKWQGMGSAVLDGSGDGDLYISSQGELVNNVTGSVYINGIDVTSSTPEIIVGEPYHIVVSYSTPQTNSIYLNGLKDSSKTPSYASYGYITIHPHSLTQAEAESRYLTYLTLSSSSVNDGVTSFGSLVEFSSTVDSVNGGNPVAYRDHTY